LIESAQITRASIKQKIIVNAVQTMEHATGIEISNKVGYVFCKNNFFLIYWKITPKEYLTIDLATLDSVRTGGRQLKHKELFSSWS
jgi:hypothetical protein